MSLGAWWIQVESTLADDVGGRALLDSDFIERVEAALAEKRIGAFAFMHKPPGIRLRFSTADSGFGAEVERWLPGSWTRGVYEPELHQFGGAVGTALAHRFFTLESLAVLRHKRRVARDAALSPYIFSLLTLHAIFRAAVEDIWEEWDLWCWHTLTGRLRPEDLTAAADLVSLRSELLPILDQPRTHMTDEEGQEWVRYEESARSIGSSVAEASRTGRLLWPLRQILPFWSIFHWNRMAFDAICQQRLAMLMVATLSPKW
jgi:thiopeptide-type bacteriocin biosynthesis protein